jgi:hypothetical protein
LNTILVAVPETAVILSVNVEADTLMYPPVVDGVPDTAPDTDNPSVFVVVPTHKLLATPSPPAVCNDPETVLVASCVVFTSTVPLAAPSSTMIAVFAFPEKKPNCPFPVPLEPFVLP